MADDESIARNRVTDAEAVLLCGGSSRRLGYPKEMLIVDGLPLAAQMVRRLKRLFASVRVITNRPAFLASYLDVPIHRDRFEGLGPLAGLHAALEHVQTPWCFLLACDMPLVQHSLIRNLLECARQNNCHAVIPRVSSRRQPLCGVYSTRVKPILERRLTEGVQLSVNGFLDLLGPDLREMELYDDACFRDIDSPDDMSILRETFRDVEPLPVRIVPIAANWQTQDVVAEEWSVAIHVNSAKLLTIQCLPSGLRELAVGVCAYLGLLKNKDDLKSLEVDYAAKLVALEVAADERSLRKAAQAVVAPTCGAGPCSGVLPPGHVAENKLVVTRTHILECLANMRAMAPAFSVTGATHQAAFSDGCCIRFFFEDIGRHNAVDKVIGKALLEEADLSQGLLVSTGRLSSEMVVKATRRRVPVLAARSAVTTGALQLAAKHGLTLVGFARDGRANVYSFPERVKDA